MEETKIRILIADDNPYIREGMRKKLTDLAGMIVVAEAESGVELINMYVKHLPDICIVAMYMKDMHGFEAIKTIRDNNYSVKSLFLSDFIDDEDIINVISVKGNGLIRKNLSQYELCTAIHEIAKNRSFFDSRINTAKINEFTYIFQNKIPRTKFSLFTNRELEILRLYSQGCISSEIGELLYISLDTVNYHKKNIMVKIGARKINQLICFATKYFMKRSTKV